MDYDKMTSDTLFLFVMMTQAALKLRSMGKDKSEFVLLASEIWNSMEMNDEQDIRDALMKCMVSDLNGMVDQTSLSSQ